MPRADDAVRLIRSRATVTDFIGEWGCCKSSSPPSLVGLGLGHCPEEEKLQLDKEKRAKKKKLFWIRILLPLGLGRFLVPSNPTKLFGFFA